jgi:hypothetical protein
LSLRAIAVLLCVSSTLSVALADEGSNDAQALSAYEEGKRFYDAGQFGAALSKFDEAARIEPTAARWQYNRGLALKKLGRNEEARAAFDSSQQLEPSYKRAEIMQKLAELSSPRSGSRMSAPARSPSSTGDFDIVPVVVLGIVVLLVLYLVWRNRAALSAGASKKSSPPTEVAAALEARLDPVATRLADVENAMRLGEDADTRALLENATHAERAARDALGQLLGGSASVNAVNVAILRAENTSTQAWDRAKAHFGEQAFVGKGERVACWFCAKPLANASVRRTISVKRGSETASLTVCQDCQQQLQSGQAPTAKVVVQGDRTVHWSEDPEYDPYVYRHANYPNASRVGFWNINSPTPLSQLATLAGGAFVGAGIAGVASSLLDFDSLRTAGLAQEAAARSARAASVGSTQRDWRDHS